MPAQSTKRQRGELRQVRPTMGVLGIQCLLQLRIKIDQFTGQFNLWVITGHALQHGRTGTCLPQDEDGLWFFENFGGK